MNPAPMGGDWRAMLKARPTVYNGIQMRSRMEARVAARLDEWPVKWQYEPQCYAAGAVQYLPDFLITEGLWIPRTGSLDGGELALPLFLETKPVVPPDNTAVLKRMEVIWASVPNAVLFCGYVDQGHGYYEGTDLLDPMEGSIAGPGMDWRGGLLGVCPVCGWPQVSLDPKEEHCVAACESFIEWAEKAAAPTQAWIARDGS